jgi:hypothetical protein
MRAPHSFLLAFLALLLIPALAQAEPQPPRTMVIDQSLRTDKALPDSVLAGINLHDFYSHEREDQGKGLTRYDRARNDFMAVATGKVFVLHVFVDDANSDWSGVPIYRHDRADMMSMTADGCDWITDRAPAAANLSFSNQGDPRVHHYYTAEIDTTIPNDADGGTNWVDAATLDIGYTDSDGDGRVVDDMLAAMLVDHPECDRACVVFHPYGDGRSYASKSISRVVLYPFMGGINTPKHVAAHEILHLFGATDEYEEGGKCPRYQCDNGVEHPWLETWYTNANCEACADDPARCIMRISQPILPVIICRHTKGHIGWGDVDEDGDHDFTDVHPISDFFCGPTDQVVSDTWFNVGVEGWTPHGHIDQIQYQVGDTIDPAGWIGVSPYDGAWDEQREYASFAIDLEQDGYTKVWVTAHNSVGQWQHEGYIQSFRIYRDTTGPGAPYVRATPNSDTDLWYNSADVTVNWDKPYDRSGVAGYSYLFDYWPTTPVPETNLGDSTSATFTADLTANWYAHVAAVDGLGNWGDQRDFRVRVDLTPPTLPVISTQEHSEQVWSKEDYVQFAFASIDTGAGVHRYATLVDQSPGTVLTNNANDNGTKVMYVDDGVRWFHAAAKDKAGNWGPTAHYELWIHTVPPTPPVVSVSDPLPGPEWHATDTVTFAWSEPVTPPGIAGYSLLKSASTYAPNPDQVLDTAAGDSAFTGLASGAHTLSVRALDGAGNWGTRGSVTIKLDHTPPPAVDIQTPSHNLAIGTHHATQSADPTVDIQFSEADDLHSGTAEYAVLWDQSPATEPTATTATSLGSARAYTSPELTTSTSWYAHVRARDEAGNWGETAHLGPIHIDVTPPGIPLNLSAVAGNRTVDLAWTPPEDPDIDHYVVYASNSPEQLGEAVATNVTGTSWQHQLLTNGDVYYYRVAAVDVVDLESPPGGQELARPLFTSPGDGTVYSGLAALATASHGGVRSDGAGGFTMHGTVKISAGDVLNVGPDQTLLAVDRTGQDELIIAGRLVVDGSGGARSLFGAVAGRPGAWGGIRLLSPDAGCLLKRAVVEFGSTNVVWHGGDPDVRDCVIGAAEQAGLDLAVAEGGTGTVAGNTLHGCGTFGLTIFAPSGSTTAISNNTVQGNQYGIYWDTALVGLPPLALDITDNVVQNNQQDGIRCGYGSDTTMISDNDVHGNYRGIVFEFEGALATTPVIQDNDIRGNSFAGVFVADQARPDLLGNTIVANATTGVHCIREGQPRLRGNTISGSDVGVDVHNSSVAPDMGDTGTSLGYNRLDDNGIYVRNLAPGSVALPAQFNYWGAAQANPGAVVQGNVLFTPTWNFTNSPPTFSFLQPAGPVVTAGQTTIAWSVTEPDTPDTLVVSLSRQTDPAGSDRVLIPGAEALVQPHFGGTHWDEFAWDVQDAPPGIYEIVAEVSDGNHLVTVTSTGTVEVQRPTLQAGPDSSAMALLRGESDILTISLANLGTADLTVSLSEDDGSGQDIPWLAAPTAPVLLNADDSTNVDIPVDASGLDDDLYRGFVTVSSTSPDIDPVELVVELTVTHGQFTVDRDSLAFAEAGAGVQRQVIINTWNSGSASLTLGALEGLEAPFSAVWLDDTTLAPGDSSRIQVSALSPVRGAWRDSLIANSSDDQQPQAVLPITFTIRGPDLEVAADTHDFAAVALGDTVDWWLVLSNAGEDSLDVFGATTDQDGFAVAFPGPFSLGPEDEASLQVSFAPTAPGALTGQVLLTHNDAGGPFTVDLSGSGQTGDAVFAGSLLDLGSSALGDTVTGTAWLRNLGDVAFEVFSAAVDSPFVLIAEGEPWTVAAGDSLGLEVGFVPLAGGEATGTLSAVTGGGGGHTPSLALRGEGLLPGLSWDEESLDYGLVAVGDARDGTVMLRNPGAGAVAVDAAFVTGSTYQITSPAFPTSIAPGDSLAVDVRFMPGGSGDSADTLLLTTPWDFLSPGQIALDGSGAEALLSLEHDFHSWLQVEVGVTHTWNLPVANAGLVPAEVMLLPLEAPFAPTDTVRGTVPAEGHLEMLLSCTPLTMGAWTDTAEVWWGDPPVLVGKVAMEAAGGQVALGPLPAGLTFDVFEAREDTVFLQLDNTGNRSLAYALVENADGKAGKAFAGGLPPLSQPRCGQAGRQGRRHSLGLVARTRGPGLARQLRPGAHRAEQPGPRPRSAQRALVAADQRCRRRVHGHRPDHAGAQDALRHPRCRRPEADRGGRGGLRLLRHRPGPDLRRGPAVARGQRQPPGARFLVGGGRSRSSVGCLLRLRFRGRSRGGVELRRRRHPDHDLRVHRRPGQPAPGFARGPDHPLLRNRRPPRLRDPGVRPDGIRAPGRCPRRPVPGTGYRQSLPERRRLPALSSDGRNVCR